jgi:hypothetical protein
MLVQPNWRTALNQHQHMVGPARQSEPHRLFVRAPIVDAGNAAPMTTAMVQDLLNHMRLDADVGHAGRDRSAKVVHPPRLHGIAEAAIEIALAVAPRAKPGTGTCAEQVVPACPRHRIDDCQRSR